MTDRRKATKMTDERRMRLDMERIRTASQDAARAFVEMHKWIANDTAGRKFDMMKRDAVAVSEALTTIALTAANWKEPTPANPTEQGEG